MGTKGRKLDIVVSMRLDPRDFARILLFWKEQGVSFEDRAGLLRQTYQDFLRLKNVKELTTEEASAILADEVYLKTPRQKVIRALVAQVDEARFKQAKALADLQQVDIDAAFEQLPFEKEEKQT